MMAIEASFDWPSWGLFWVAVLYPDGGRVLKVGFL
jgi:hypothetical protein